MSNDNADYPHQGNKREPKFCKCRVCHEYFYAETIAQASQQCQAHVAQHHPDWQETGCYCPDY